MFRQSTPLERGGLVLGSGLRVLFAALNRAANDDHLPVIHAIAFEHRFPGTREYWESFQPKLYHTTVALLWRLLPARAPLLQIQAAQMVSCLAGILTILALAAFLRRLPISDRARTGAVLFWSLNPTLIGISAQATNDAFVILFGTLAIIGGYRFLQTHDLRHYVGLVAATLGGVLAKGNGLVLLAAGTLALLANAAARVREGAWRRGKRLLAASLFVGTVLPAAWFLTPMHSNLRDEGTPFVTNWPRSPAPNLLHQTYVDRPGITSVVHGFLTFRLVDLLEHPTLTHGPDRFSLHRTSLWTQLYAQTYLVHFAEWPPEWVVHGRMLDALARADLLLALVPTSLFLVGFVGVLWRCARMIQGRVALDPPTVLVGLAAAGFVAFQMLYSFEIRDFSTMKAIFLFPGLAAFSLMAIEAYERLIQGCSRSPWIRRLVEGATVGVLACGLVDVLWVIGHVGLSLVGERG